jgi:hypothetical protein
VPCESNYIRAESTEHATLRIDKKHVGSLVEQSDCTRDHRMSELSKVALTGAVKLWRKSHSSNIMW